MFGYKRINEKQLNSKEIQAIIKMQMISSIKNDISLKEKVLLVNKEFLMINKDLKKGFNVFMINKDNYKILNESMTQATRDGELFDESFLNVLSKVNNKNIIKTLVIQLNYNMHNDASSLAKNYGLRTKINFSKDYLNNVRDNKDIFSTEKLYNLTYPILKNGDDLSIVNLLTCVIESDDLKSEDVKHKLQNIKTILTKFRHLETTQKMRYLKQSLIYTIESNKINECHLFRNDLNFDAHNINKDFCRGEKTKNYIKEFKEDNYNLDELLDIKEEVRIVNKKTRTLKLKKQNPFNFS